MISFDNVFVDSTKYATKLKTSEYDVKGKNIIVDQGQNIIAGYTDLNEGVYNEVPALIFGDHTRCIKYVDNPFFLGADGVKILKLKTGNTNYKYWYYALKNVNIPNTGYNRHFKWLKEAKFREHSIIEQQKIVEVLDLLINIIDKKEKQLNELDNLIKSRFIELFVEWASNPEPLKSFLEDITYGFTNPMPDAEEGPWKVTAKDVVDGKVNYNTARKTTVQAFDELTAKSKPTVGDVLLTKDGTLGRCAVVEDDGICVNQSVAVLKCNEKILPKFLAILLQMPEYQREMLKNAGGGTIKHIYITKVVDMLIVVPSISQQREFLSFVEQTDKSKFEIQKSIDELQKLYDSLMQEYFG